MERFSCVVASGNCHFLSTRECTEFLTNCLGRYIIGFPGLQVFFLLTALVLILAKVDHWDSEGRPLLFPLQKQSRVWAYGSHKRKMIKIAHTERTIKIPDGITASCDSHHSGMSFCLRIAPLDRLNTSNMVNTVGLSLTLSYMFYVKSIGI